MLSSLFGSFSHIYSYLIHQYLMVLYCYRLLAFTSNGRFLVHTYTQFQSCLHYSHISRFFLRCLLVSFIYQSCGQYVYQYISNNVIFRRISHFSYLYSSTCVKQCHVSLYGVIVITMSYTLGINLCILLTYMCVVFSYTLLLITYSYNIYWHMGWLYLLSMCTATIVYYVIYYNISLIS